MSLSAILTAVGVIGSLGEAVELISREMLEAGSNGGWKVGGGTEGGGQGRTDLRSLSGIELVDGWEDWSKCSYSEVVKIVIKEEVGGPA